MKLIIGNRCFCPKFITSFLTLIFLGLFISLGFWQLDRAEYKRNLYSDFKNRQSAQSLNLDQDINNNLNIKELIWRHVNASGEFLEHYQILLDNQVHDTKAGYFVYTPFQLVNSNKAVLVNRGWILANLDRSVSPDYVLTDGIVEIEGVAKETPKTGLLLKDLPPEKVNEKTHRVQRIDIDELSELTQLNLMPFIIRLDTKSDHGYVRKWQLPGSGENTHYGYAFQWFSFAAVLVIIYLVLNIKKIEEKDLVI